MSSETVFNFQTAFLSFEIGYWELSSSKSYTCSFHGSTLVKTADGCKAIAHIQISDRVFAMDEASGKTGYKPVTPDTAIRIGNRLHWNFRRHRQQPNPDFNKIHPFYSQGKWIQAGRLKKATPCFPKAAQNRRFKTLPSNSSRSSLQSDRCRLAYLLRQGQSGGNGRGLGSCWLSVW